MPYLLVTLCCLFACLGSFLFGYDSGVISSVIDQDSFRYRFHNPSAAATGGIVASYNGSDTRADHNFFAFHLRLTFCRRCYSRLGFCLLPL